MSYLKTLSVLLLAFAAFCLFAQSIALDTKLTTSAPLLIWSDRDYFQGNVQHLDSISQFDLEYLLQTSCGLKSPIISTVGKYVSASIETDQPEVLVVFVEQTLGSETLRKNSEGKEEKMFQNLKSEIETASSSISFPYTLIGQSFSLSESLLGLVSALKQKTPTSSLVLARPDGSSVLNELTVDFTSLPSDLLREHLSNSDIYNNGVTDVVVVVFDSDNLKNDDELVGTVQKIVDENTAGRYVSMFTAVGPSKSRVIRSYESAHGPDGRLRDEDIVGANLTYTNYFPIFVFEAIIISALLLLIACVGAICTFNIQTPQRFEVPKQKRNEGPM